MRHARHVVVPHRYSVANMDPRESAPERSSFEFADEYQPALKIGAVLDAVLFVIGALMLDGGRAFGFVGIALGAHWIGNLMTMARRPLAPTRFDRFYVRYG